MLCIAAIGLMLAQNAVMAQPGKFGRGRARIAEPINTEKGFLFIDGAYLPPPYGIEVDGTAIRINDREYVDGYFDVSNYPDRVRRMGMRGGGQGRGGMEVREGSPPSSRAVARHVQMLDLGAIIVLAEGRPPLELWPTQSGHELLQALLAKSDGAPASGEIPSGVASESERESWRQLVAGFEPTAEFVQRATAQVRIVEEAAETNRAQSNATLWIERITFPLTILALVAVVLAAGHLMTNAPLMVSGGNDARATADVKKAMIRSLAIIGVLSMIDLGWTLMAHQSGSMRELNPLGSKLIDDPQRLIMFKIGITSASIGLLYWLHETPLAQRASWWCCLILTLLTARWLTFNSMFL